MKQLNRIAAVGVIVIATIVGITITTAKSNKLRNIHHARMEQPLPFKSISN
ncbi:MAG: hypothetical protein V4590_05695 [Bacteroidota bacterium]